MARCNYCGVEPLDWQVEESTYRLMEPDGEPHTCKPEDRRKEKERIQKQREENEAIVRKHREANGYL